MRRLLLAGATLVLAGSSSLSACDLCALYTAFAASDARAGWSVGLSEQFTSFGTVQQEGEPVADPFDQSLRSSITQVVVAYQWHERFGVQANLPWIDRSFRRLEDGAVESGRERGVGDVAVLAHWRALERVAFTRTLRVTLLGGVKLPTGSSDRLAEEVEEGRGAHGGPGAAGAVHGHDLALGSGSTDLVAGLSLAATFGRGYLSARAQQAFRGTGDFDYRFGDDFQYGVAGGGYVVLRHDRSLALGVGLAGEHKQEDRLAGEALDDTAIDSLFAGPLASLTLGEVWFGELALDLPVAIDNSGLQIVPDWRVRLALTRRF